MMTLSFLILLGISFFSVVALIALEKQRHQKALDQEKQAFGQTLQRSLQVQKQLEQTTSDLRRLEEGTQQLSLMFDQARALEATLEIGPFVQALQGVLAKALGFQKAWLIIGCETTADGKRVGRVYEMGPSETNSPLHPSEATALHEQWAQQLCDARDPLPLASGDAQGIGLFSQARLIGAIVLARPKDGQEALLRLVAGQVALHLRRVQLYQAVQEMALFDGLTGVFVRRHVMERLQEEFQRGQRLQYPLSVLMIDIDHFKQYNDAYGHLVGDVALQEVARLIRQGVRGLDVVGRYGGEEFLCVLPEADGPAAKQVAERIRSQVALKPLRAYDETTQITISIGVASYPKDALQPDALVESADVALYRAKDEGRNRVVMAGDSTV